MLMKNGIDLLSSHLSRIKTDKEYKEKDMIKPLERYESQANFDQQFTLSP